MNKALIISIVIIVLMGLGFLLLGNMGEETETEETTNGERVEVETPNIDGTSWDFDSMGRMSFNDGQYSVSVGCNSIGGEYVLEGNSISFGQSMTTLIGCPPHLEEAENELTRILPLLDTIEVSQNQITLSGDGVELILVKPRDMVLEGMMWDINAIQEGGGVVSSVVDEGTFLSFDTDGKFYGRGACNNINGTYSVEGNIITFGPIASTKMMCQEEEMEREALLIKTLENATTFNIDRETLTIESADSEYSVTLTTQDLPMD